MAYSMCERCAGPRALSVAAVVAVLLAAMPAKAAFHFWALNEIYTNNTGTLQFIELVDPFGGQNFVGSTQIMVTDSGGTITNTYTLPATTLPGSTLNHSLLFGTAALQAAGGPAPDFIIPDNFLFSAGGSIQFFGSNSGAYTALPTNGILSRVWNGGNAVNSPKNFSGQTGTVPAPAALALLTGGGLALWRRRRPA